MVLTLLALLGLFAAVAVIMLFRSVVVVPQQTAYVVERLGQFSGILDSGFHIVVPFIDAVRARHTLAEQSLTLPEENVDSARGPLRVAATLRIRVADARLASNSLR